MFKLKLFLSMPLPMVALPCGSRSTSNTRFFCNARLAARLIAVVVLPTPPFWFAIQNTRGDFISFVIFSYLLQPYKTTLSIQFRHVQFLNLRNRPRALLFQL